MVGMAQGWVNSTTADADTNNTAAAAVGDLTAATLKTVKTVSQGTLTGQYVALCGCGGKNCHILRNVD